MKRGSNENSPHSSYYFFLSTVVHAYQIPSNFLKKWAASETKGKFETGRVKIFQRFIETAEHIYSIGSITFMQFPSKGKNNFDDLVGLIPDAFGEIVRSILKYSRIARHFIHVDQDIEDAKMQSYYRWFSDLEKQQHCFTHREEKECKELGAIKFMGPFYAKNKAITKLKDICKTDQYAY